MLPVDLNKIKLGLSQVKISGRIEIVPGAITEIHDVAHNPDAIEKLRNYLKQNPLEKNKKTLAVFSMLQDKDISQCIQIIKNDIDQWYIAELPVQRSASASLLNNIFKKFKVEFELFHSIKEAYQQSKKIANPGDRIIAFGSFHVLAAIKAPAQS